MISVPPACTVTPVSDTHVYSSLRRDGYSRVVDINKSASPSGNEVTVIINDANGIGLME
jgi:hypothetical protein